MGVISLILTLYSLGYLQGTIIDSTALSKALDLGWISGAGLDVLDGEPNIPADHPLVLNERCVVLPHLGSATIETREGMALLGQSFFFFFPSHIGRGRSFYLKSMLTSVVSLTHTSTHENESTSNVP